MNAFEFVYESMGTVWSITVENAADLGDAASFDDAKKDFLKAEILKLSEAFDKTYSRFREDSLVINSFSKPGVYPLSPEFKELLSYYKNFYDATDGRFTPFIGQMLVDAGYDKEYSFTEKALQDIPSWEEAIRINGDSIEVLKPIIIDVGAIGKGFFVDTIASWLSSQGYKDFLVNGGGDIYTSTSRGEVRRAGLEHPLDEKKVIGVVNIKNKALCGSAGNRRAWGQYHHIIDPKTKKSPEDIIATWVIAEKAAVADGAATCLFFVPPEKLSNFDIQYVILHKDLHVTYSLDLDLELF